MDLVPVAPGMAAAAARTARGPDPLWWAADTYDFFVSCAVLLKAVAGPNPNTLMARSSTVLLLLGDSFIVDSAAHAGLLDLLVALRGATPLAVSALVGSLRTAGLDLSVVYQSRQEFVAAVNAVFDAFDLTNIPAGMLLTPASMDHKEAVAGGAGAAGGRWCREVSLALLSRPISPSHPSLMRTSFYGCFAYFAGGTYLAARRDPATSQLRMLMDMLAEAAISLKIPFAGAGNGNPKMAALAAVGAFTSIVGRDKWLIAGDAAPNLGDDVLCAHRLSQISYTRMLTSRESATFLLAVDTCFGQLGEAFPGLTPLFKPMPSSANSFNLLLTMLHQGIYANNAAARAISLPSSQEELVALDSLVVPYLGVVDAHQPPLTVAIDRTQFAAVRIREGLTLQHQSDSKGGDDAESVSKQEASELQKLMREASEVALYAKVQAELAKPSPDSVHIQGLLVQSSVHIIRRFALGFPVALGSLPSEDNLFKKAEVHVKQFRKNLSLCLVADDAGNIPSKAADYEVSAEVAEHVRSMQWRLIDIPRLTYEVLGRRNDTTYAVADSDVTYCTVEGIGDVQGITRRLEAFVGVVQTNPQAPVVNSLTAALDTLKRHVGKLGTEVPDVAKPGWLLAGVTFVVKATAELSSVWGAYITSKVATQRRPTYLVDPLAACWDTLLEQQRGVDEGKKLKDVHGPIFLAAGIDLGSTTTRPGGGYDPAALLAQARHVVGAASSKRPRSPAAAPQSPNKMASTAFLASSPTSYSAGMPSPSWGGGASSSSFPPGSAPPFYPPGGHTGVAAGYAQYGTLGNLAHKLTWMPNGKDFKFTSTGNVANVDHFEQQLGIQGCGVCGPVVLHKSTDPVQRARYCIWARQAIDANLPVPAAHASPTSAAHVRPPGTEAYIAAHFEGPSASGGGGGTVSPSGQTLKAAHALKTENAALVAQNAALKLQAEQAGKKPGSPSRSPSPSHVPPELTTQPPKSALKTKPTVGGETPDEVEASHAVSQGKGKGKSGKGGGGKGAKGDADDKPGKGGRGGKGRGRGKGGRGKGGKGRSLTWAAGAAAASKAEGAASGADAATPDAPRSPSRRFALLPVVALEVQRRALLFVVALVANQPASVLAPACGAVVPGIVMGGGASRDQASRALRGSAAQLTVGARDPCHCYLAAEHRVGEAGLDWLVVAPSLSRTYAAPLCISVGERLAQPSDALVWGTLDAWAGSPVYTDAAVCIARALTFRGALELHGVDAAAVAVADRVLGPTSDSVYVSGAVGPKGAGAAVDQWVSRGVSAAEAVAADAQAQRQFSEHMEALPLDHPHREYLLEWCSMARPIALDDIPPALLVDRALPDFSDPRLEAVDFVDRCRPPVTAPIAPPTPQTRRASEGFRRYMAQPGRTIAHLFPAGYFSAKVQQYQWALSAWLNDIFANGADATARPPGDLVFAQSEMLLEARGIFWELAPGGGVREVDFQRRPRTHLDLDYILSFAEGGDGLLPYDDQAIFHHLEWGVDFFSGQEVVTEMQLVLQKHLLSLADAYPRLQQDLQRRVGLGWCTVYDQVPKCPWKPFPVGTRARQLGGRPRGIVHASAPMYALTDVMGAKALPLNILAKRDEDEARGCCQTCFDAWDGRLRVTAGSPPPSPPRGQALPPSPAPTADSAVATGALPSNGASAKRARLSPATAPQPEPFLGHRRALHLFNGSGDAVVRFADGVLDGGVACDEVDSREQGCGGWGDLLRHPSYSALLDACRSGVYAFVLVQFPADTFSVGRIGGVGNSRRLRGRDTRGILGLPDLPPHLQLLVERTNLLLERTVEVMLAVWRAGGAVVFAAPADRGGGRASNAHFLERFRSHASIQLMPCMQRFLHTSSAQSVTFALGSLGASRQHLTTFWFTAGLRSALSPLASLGMAPEGDDSTLGGAVADAAPAAARAYPPRLVMLLVAAALGAASDSRSPRWAVGSAVGGHASADLDVAASHAPPKNPKEIKVLFWEAMSDFAVLKFLGFLLNVFLFIFTDDFRDWFYQAALAAKCEWLAGMITLELDRLAASPESPAELRYLVDHQLGQGTINGSNIGQRLGYLVLHIYRYNLSLTEGAALAADRATNEILDGWCARREARGLVARRDTSHLYTDDALLGLLSVAVAERGLVAWRTTCSRMRVIMAQAEKRQGPTNIIFLGLGLCSTLGIGYVPLDKLMRAVASLKLVVAGEITIDQYQSLLGLLLHLAFISGQRRSSMYGMWSPFGAGGAAEYGPATPLVGDALTPIIVAQSRAWISRLTRCAGAPFLAACHEFARSVPIYGAEAATRAYWRSDSAKEGTATPGVAGIVGGTYWVRPFTTEELKLPIAVTEFAGHYGNSCVFPALTPAPIEIVAELDALTSVRNLTEEASKSPLMQHVQLAILALPEYQEDVCHRLTVAHIFGDANPTADAASRGYFEALHEMLAHIGCRPRRIPYPPQLDVLLAELCLLNASLNARKHEHLDTACDVTNASFPSPFAHRSITQPGVTIGSFASALLLAAAPVGGAAAPVTTQVGRCARTAYLYPSSGPTPDAAVQGSLPSPGVLSGGLTPSRKRPFLVVEAQTSLQVVVSSRRVIQRGAALDDAPGLVPSTSYGDELATRLLSDVSAHALHPRNASGFRHLCASLFDTEHDNANSQRQLNSNMRLWSRYCEEMGTPLWRPDAAGLSPNERQREIVLSAGFIPWALNRMRGRRGNQRAKPQSAFNAFLGVRRAHRQRGIELTETRFVRVTLKRMCMRHIRDFGAQSLVPKRKEPLTYAIITALVGHEASPLPSVVTGTHLGQTRIDWDTRHGRALKGLLVVASRTGMRKSELTLDAQQTFDRTCASRAHLSWHLRGRLYRQPPLHLLQAPMPGDHAVLVPPVSKADQFGEVWGASPIYLAHRANEPLCAFSALAQIEIHDPVQSGQREATPLFSPDGQQPFKGAALAALLALMLRFVVGPTKAKVFSFHSFRVFLACSLLASGATAPQIMALCRWQTEESLAIYARLNPEVYTELLERSIRADVTSVSSANLPTLSGEQTLREIFLSADAELSETAAALDAAGAATA